METFIAPKEFVENNRYTQDRRDVLAALDLSSIDEPIKDIVAGIAALPHCFPIQSCAGHFICGESQDIHTLDRIRTGYTGPVRYRIAYIAVCMENSPLGRALRQSFAEIPAIDPTCIQFGSANWFWDQWKNSYALQVEPVSFMYMDEATLDIAEALRIQRAKDMFFKELRRLLSSLQDHSFFSDRD